MIWTLRRILVLIVLASTIAVVGTLVWVTATYQRFAIETQNDATAELVEYLVRQRVEEDYLRKLLPFADEWSRVSTFVDGMQENPASVARHFADRMMFTLEVTSGRIRLRNVVVYSSDFEVVAVAERGTGESIRANISVLDNLRTQTLQQRRVIDSFLWRTSSGRPVHSIIVPLGGFRVAGFIELVTDPVPELGGLGEVLGGTFRLLDGYKRELIVDNVEFSDEVAKTDPGNLETLTVALADTIGGTWAYANLTRDTSAFRQSAFDLRDQAISIVALVVLASVLFG